MHEISIIKNCYSDLKRRDDQFFLYVGCDKKINAQKLWL
jgi:hypothetical protein